MSKKMLAILGGPHKDGATGKMLNYATEIAEKKGWEIEYVNLYEKEIGYCRGCKVCDKTGMCVFLDDLQGLAKSLQECDAVVLAAPVYWANVPAAVKNMFDRLVGVAMQETKTFPKPRLSNKQKYYLLTACNTQAPFAQIFGQSTGAIRSMKEFFKTAGMRFGGKCVWTGSKKQELPAKIKQKIEKWF